MQQGPCSQASSPCQAAKCAPSDSAELQDVHSNPCDLPRGLDLEDPGQNSTCSECEVLPHPAKPGAMPTMLGKRKLPNSFNSGQQSGQPGAASALRPLTLPKVNQL